MNFQELLKNKKVLYGVIAGALVLVALIITLAVVLTPKGTDDPNTPKKEEVLDKQMDLLTTADIGQAIEIQALLARNGINAIRTTEGSKSTITLDKGTKMTDRDKALLVIVRSGLMDKNIGLEVFDKGDFTSSKEDKKIRLARAVNGELARLIKKIDGIEDATVFVSIPTQESMFTSMQKPITATVQVSLTSSGAKLDRDKVRTIKNLMIGSIQGLDAKNLSITDTDGNVYSSVDSADDDMMDLLEENDQYMKKKVMSQLDRLLGKGNYVVTVSTYLREAPLETTSVVYDPKKSGVLTAQRFSESLGDRALDSNKMNGATSTFLPGGLPNQNSSSNSRNYNRSAEDMQYGISKTQYQEQKNPGMMEEISIAITLDNGSLPDGMTLNDLKQLAARSASPKADPKDVTIAFSDASSPILSPDMPSQLPKPESSGNPWWSVAVLLGVGLLVGLVFIYYRAKKEAERQQQAINDLLEKSDYQQNLLKEAQDRSNMVQEQLQNLLAGNGNAQLPDGLQDTIEDIKENMEGLDDKEMAVQLRSWIESI